MGKDIWCAAGDDGACSVRKARGEEKGDGDGTAKIVDGFSGFGKGNGEKGGVGVGLREDGGQQLLMDVGLFVRMLGPKGMQACYLKAPQTF